GVPSVQLAREMTARYLEDTGRLDLGRPDSEPLASETIEPIVALIERLVERGHAYAAEGDVYFSVGSWPAYGSLSHQDPASMDQGEGGEGAERKRDPRDFALWKARKAEEDAWWGSPWGEGRPGWHIECSAMAEELLGLDFEIHGGGSDLVFPHHENEAAQTEAAHDGIALARLWVHNGMVQMGEEKMAKSVGNIRLLHRALEEFGRDAVIAYFLEGHYRQPIAFSTERLKEAGARVTRIREAARRLVRGPSPVELTALRERFFDALADDFNTPEALAVVAEWIRDANRRGGLVGDADLREMLEVLGLGRLVETDAEEDEVDERVCEMVRRREEARASRDFAAADRLREEIGAAGWEVRDGPAGPELVRAS
ncbi:MAG: DALR domain-containing protein, partial [Solirubrobacteraceae bacterium]